MCLHEHPPLNEGGFKLQTPLENHGFLDHPTSSQSGRPGSSRVVRGAAPHMLLAAESEAWIGMIPGKP
jgi:hypothetical protein